jgi:heptosyltransferase III
MYSAAPDLLCVAGRLPFNPLANLLGGAALYIGPDTSVTHLAAACAVPVIALYGPIDPCLWGPWPQGAPALQPYMPRAEAQRVRQVIVLQGSQPCVPCNKAGCDDHNDSRADCLQTMLPERVLAQARAVLAEAGAAG